MKDLLDPDASVVTISISTTRMASENYGFMAPVKAALDSSIAFLAKSFSRFSRVRFNAVCPGLLKTSASAGIPGYVDSYLYAEQATLRKEALKTEEVANAVAFLLSPRSSGINAQQIVLDAGMSVNYFDRELIQRGHTAVACPSSSAQQLSLRRVGLQAEDLARRPPTTPHIPGESQARASSRSGSSPWPGSAPTPRATCRCADRLRPAFCRTSATWAMYCTDCDSSTGSVLQHVHDLAQLLLGQLA